MKILAIDPGTTKSGVVNWIKTAPERGSMTDRNFITDPQIITNEEVLAAIPGYLYLDARRFDLVVIEWIQSQGMAVGKTTFETCLWVGRFVEEATHRNIPVRCVPRGAIKMHHCGSMRAKDGNISQSLRDKYGEKGTKADPGFFFGVASHAWQACAVAAYVAEGADHEDELRY